MNKLIKTKDLFRDAKRIDNKIRYEKGDLICSKTGVSVSPLSRSDRAYVEGLKRIRNAPMEMNP